MSKKKFGLNQSIERGFSETIRLAESYEINYENKPLTLSRVLTDPTNPRHLKVTAENLRNIIASISIVEQENLNETEIPDKIIQEYFKQISILDVDKDLISSEMESLKELALGISKNGLLHPIITYKEGEHYIIVAGERRFLAHLLLNRKYIESRVFMNKPSGSMKKIAQWIENVQREDLSAYSRVENVIHIAEEYFKEHKKALTPTVLSEISGISKASASYYLSLVNGPEDVILALKNNQLNNIKKASLIAGESNFQKRQDLLKAALTGATVDSLKSKKNQIESPLPTTFKSNRKGRAYSNVQFGATKNIEIARKVVIAVVKQYKLSSFQKKIEHFDWSSYEALTHLFKDLLAELDEK